jgi:molybdopterin/thiamine biosynthesis adenylyltransferase
LAEGICQLAKNWSMAGTGKTDMNSDRTFDRIDALFDIKLFENIRVLVAGCGSGGASVALQLVMSGVRNFTLIDNDTLEVENVIRHVCGRQYLGRRKVDAVADVLRDRNPKVNIKAIDADLLSLPSLADEIASSDVIILATDNEPTRYAINEICVEKRKAFVVGRVFTRGIGGEVFAFRPGGACLACLEAFLQRTNLRDGTREIDLVTEAEREKVYGMEIAEIKDSPGLAVDIAFITAFHARFALDAIGRALEERPKYLMPISENYLYWGNRPVHPFTKNFQLQRVELTPQDGCAVCAEKRQSHV